MKPSMNSTKSDHLGPGDAVQSRAAQIWDPTIGAFRAQRLPIALSKSSFTTNATNGGSGHDQARRSSSSSYSMATRYGSSVSTCSYSSARSFPPSLVSLPPNYSKNSKPLPKAPKRMIFKALSSEVYDCILRQLEKLHESPSSDICPTCYMRDLCSLSLTSRAWDKAAVKRLYNTVYIVGHDSKEQTRRYKIKTGIRLKLLRRTLRERGFLAQHVRELRVLESQADGDISKDIIDTVASLVMACPNLERLVGFYPAYNHESDRLTHALSTRRELKERVWLIGENAAVTQRSHKQLAPGLMDIEQKASFMSYHSAWSSMTTLFLHSPDQGVLEEDIFVNMDNTGDPRKVRGPGILHRLPSLKHLCISNFDVDDFTDIILQELPPLESLRLQDLEGVTFWGLSEYSRTTSASGLQNLSLVNLDILYISAISNLLLHLKNLRRFTLVQDNSPKSSDGEIVFQPIIASHSVEYIHWDIAVPGSANINLAHSIEAEGFPQLRTIRVPSDHDGLIQTLCKPRAQIETPDDWAGRDDVNSLGTGSLRRARQAAQRRIEEAWSTVQYKIVVEESSVIHEIFDLNGFMGIIGSNIHYDLDPDIPGSDTALIDFLDIIDRNDDMAVDNTCKGLWNPPRSDDRLQHAERPRYRPIDLQKFF